MSRHSSAYLAPSILQSASSPTTSTELLISGSGTQPFMDETKQGESSKGSRSRSSSSTMKRSRHTDTERNDAIEMSRSSTPSQTQPQAPPSAHLYPSRLSHDQTPSISPSALEAGYTKELDSTRITPTATCEEKRDERNVSKVWPPWKRDDGWTGWKSEWVKKEALVVPLVVQAFSAGVLDATTYADFMTFASNRMYPPAALELRSVC